jgi:hypothetical protein
MPSALSLGFERDGEAISVAVELGVNDDPAALGCPEFARGFPYCRSTISPPARGYGDCLGWIQLVRQPESGEGFVLDPFEPLGEPSSPFCFFGFAPTQFDAPHRDTRPDMDWTSHTFLGGLAGIHMVAEARIGIGFSWGFRIRSEQIEITGPAPLTAADWDRHLPYLRQIFPDWAFAPGFALGDPPG